MSRKSATLILLLCIVVADIDAITRIRPTEVPSTSSRTAVSRLLHTTCRLDQIRGGSDDEASDTNTGDQDFESDDYSDDESPFLPETLFNKDTTSTLINAGKKTFYFFGRIALRTASATSRALVAAFQTGAVTEADDETSLVTKATRVLRRMFKAAFQSEEADELVKPTAVLQTDRNAEEVSSQVPTERQSLAQDVPVSLNQASEKIRLPDFGSYLSKSYGVEATRDDLDDDEKGMPILGGTFSDALRIARSKARLLVVMIPTSKPGKSHGPDVEAIKGLLSAEVATVAEQKARKSGETGSYVIWGAKAGSAEAVTALKRIKATQTNAKGQKRPILLVVYPAQVTGSDGLSRIVPRLLAQHHCSPPPSSETMAAWLNALRKRHAKQFATMQLEVKELELHRERTEGYKGSIQSDRERQQREIREAEEKRRKEEAEKEHLKTIVQRREDLRRTMPVEPSSDDQTAKTIALRLADGRTSQRRFAADTKLEALFNWVDAEFELERENVRLTTLNGQKSFEWNSNSATLDEAGFSRMAGLRVTERKV